MLATIIFTSLFYLVVAQADYSAVLTARHNDFRALHGVSNLTWSSTIASVAQSHVSSCNFALYSGSGNYGQNVAAGGFDPIESVVDYLYTDGAAAYDYGNPGFSQETGTFTQIVWKATTQIGCGVQDCDGLNGTPGAFIACFYLPAGNIIGRFEQNVLPPVSSVGTSGLRVAKVEAPEVAQQLATSANTVKRSFIS